MHAMVLLKGTRALCRHSPEPADNYASPHLRCVESQTEAVDQLLATAGEDAPQQYRPAPCCHTPPASILLSALPDHDRSVAAALQCMHHCQYMHHCQLTTPPYPMLCCADASKQRPSCPIQRWRPAALESSDRDIHVYDVSHLGHVGWFPSADDRRGPGRATSRMGHRARKGCGHGLLHQPVDTDSADRAPHDPSSATRMGHRRQQDNRL